jgi:hypothetical protein
MDAGDDPAFSDHPGFVKNLEGVSGKERGEETGL